MNRNKLKTYAPQARRDFIRAVTDRATQYGLAAKKIEPMTEQGEVVLIAGQPFPKAVGVKRAKLDARIQKLGFDQTMEAMAYTWFNRLVAIRFMELHGYLEHGYRVLSHPDGHTQPEILAHAEHVDLPGLDPKKIVELKLDGTKEEELYRLLLIAQCNALHAALPFLFESIDDETELLLPDHLLHSDSLIRNLVNEIDEADWQEVEIIGWLYQFYISEKKDQVIGKMVASEDIPAATQLFTPNWIVKYLVQNTLGRQWLTTYPNSPLRQQMRFYIEPANQTPEVQEKLKAITPSALNPEELTLLDPACGSGHILVEAYDLFKAIYQERGYRTKDIPAFILQKNLFGLEIDDRAAQLAAFALMMKARADDRRIFHTEAKPNILAFEDCQDMDAAAITHAINSPIPSIGEGHISKADISSLLELFENAKVVGSLIQVPLGIGAKLPEIDKRLNVVLKHGDLTHKPARAIKPFLDQARLLVGHYQCVVANPPYMGGKYLSLELKRLVNRAYKEAKADLYACFLQRNLSFASASGFVGMITIPNWMFLASFEELRLNLFKHHAIDTFVHNGRGVFGSDFGSCSFVIRNLGLPAYRGTFRRLFEKQGSVSSNDELRERFATAFNYTPSNEDFSKIPGSPVAYWVSPQMRNAFAANKPLGSVSAVKQGMSSADNPRFTREWWEVCFDRIAFNCESRDSARASRRRWFPYNKGGPFRKWYGNLETVIDWENDGESIRQHPGAAIRNPEFFFREGVTWTDISSSCFGVRLLEKGALFANTGSCCFSRNVRFLLGFLATPVAFAAVRILNPSLHTEIGDVTRLPLVEQNSPFTEQVTQIVEQAISIARTDWNSSEKSWDFESYPFLQHTNARDIKESQVLADAACLDRFSRMKALEEENNCLFIEKYGLQDEISPVVPDNQITLNRPDRAEDIKRLLSYAIGCVMGRYSLDKPGLIYANSGNQGFDASQYQTFAADEDGIVTLMEFDWYPDDAASRFEKFLATAWPAEGLDGNLEYVAESLGSKKGESPRETIRRYFAVEFFKHHLSMYKKRPIYWLFSSGRQRGFQAVVYLHRYNERTLARMRTEYVIPLLGKMTARIDHLADDVSAVTSTQHRKRLEAEKATITKQLAEVQAFEERLRHYADLRIKLDLDDGVKINYGKFSDPEIGDILAEVKAIAGGKDEEQ